MLTRGALSNHRAADQHTGAVGELVRNTDGQLCSAADRHDMLRHVLLCAKDRALVREARAKHHNHARHRAPRYRLDSGIVDRTLERQRRLVRECVCIDAKSDGIQRRTICNPQRRRRTDRTRVHGHGRRAPLLCGINASIQLHSCVTKRRRATQRVLCQRQRRRRGAALTPERAKRRTALGTHIDHGQWLHAQDYRGTSPSRRRRPAQSATDPTDPRSRLRAESRRARSSGTRLTLLVARRSARCSRSGAWRSDIERRAEIARATTRDARRTTLRCKTRAP
jgi:hypothetical protein